MKLSIFTNKIRLPIAACVLAFSFTSISCKSTEIVIDETMTPQQLIQNGQNEYQKGKYKNALKYYQAVVDRPEVTPSNYVEARYEIGHLYMKQKNYKAAKPIFEEIQEMFVNTLPGTLPAAYNKLAEIELAKIPETKQAIEAKKVKEEEEARKKHVEEADEY